MTDVLGWRRLLGVIAPSTNTVVQPDMERMRPPGVTNHLSRIHVEDPVALSNEDFIAGTTAIAENTLDAVRSVMTCRPDYLVLGMSAVTFYGGVDGSRRFKARIEAEAGVGATTGAEAVAAALTAVGAKAVSFVSPYYPVANAEVRQFLEESGFAVRRDRALHCRRWTDIAKVTPETLREVIAQLDGDDVDAIVQVGTNLSMVDLAAEYEVTLGKPVIAINTATYWHALRACGISDKLPGLGRLLSEF
ncbi:arylmalonate decarboxylase [Novosphingobium resinovorum]|uniref:maleate cis-trans isomerase family protein n=1 Tax=Sphingomonadaceae TaxID=41297 RepID=UPI00027CABB7|nr:MULTISPECIES: arylmalonate decarboxylase [Sphingomonadaceae]EJU09939.1 arylmalonate decarboxylase [Sphingomonas sp. LH128]MBF7013602.1 arylmalonate decarboxylase [Novosphingobium sp. HR1a]WJM25752.1 arylmalonate decarboxylase [Novosphingobium resinovorum]